MVSNNSKTESKLSVKKLELPTKTALHMEQNEKLLQKLNQEGGQSCSTLPEGSKKTITPVDSNVNAPANKIYNQTHNTLGQSKANSKFDSEVSKWKSGGKKHHKSKRRR